MQKSKEIEKLNNSLFFNAVSDEIKKKAELECSAFFVQLYDV